MAGPDRDLARGLRIFPGKWKPHYRWEQVAWIAPPWLSHDYLWLDFPEAIFTDQGTLFLSHVNPEYPTVFENLPKVEWKTAGDKISIGRALPNGVRFEGALRPKNENTAGLSFAMENGSDAPLTGIQVTMCLNLRHSDEFNHPTMTNKKVHVEGDGWIPWTEAIERGPGTGIYSIGWDESPKIADRPKIVTVSDDGQRGVSMTWFENTGCLVGTSKTPCMHANPFMPDLGPGDRAEIEGEIEFLESLPFD